MNEYYSVDGVTYRITSIEEKNRLLNKFPDAILVSRDPVVSNVPSIPEIKELNWFDEVFKDSWFGRGKLQASTTGESFNLLMEGSQVTSESINNLIEATKSQNLNYVPSQRMRKFQENYQKRGGSWWAFAKGVSEDPMLLAELFTQSLGTQVGTLYDSEEAQIATGAAFLSTFTGSMALSKGDLRAKVIKSGGRGLMVAQGTLVSIMESSLTFSELIQEELKKSNENWTDENFDEWFTEENIRNLLTGSQGSSIRYKAIGRGLTIGTIEALTTGIAGKAVTRTLSKPGRATKVKAIAAGAGVEMIGGGTGEVAGRFVAGQEMDPAEIGFETVTGLTSTPISVLYGLGTYKKPVYTLNSNEVTFEEMKDFIDNADDIDIAKANIKMENDMTGLNVKAYKKQSRAIIEQSIDEKITDKKDRETLIELETERQQLLSDKKKEGAAQSVGNKQNLERVENEISAIIDKYAGAVGIFKTEQGAAILQRRGEIALDETIKFLETNKKFVGKDVVVGEDINETQNAYRKAAEEYNRKNPNEKQYDVNKDITKSDGFVVGDVIVINKPIAGLTGQINVGAHELLHGIITKHFNSLDTKGKTKLITDFRNTISKESDAYILKELRRRKSAGETGLNLNTTQEWLTVYSDGITKGEITFNESISVKLKNFLQNIFRKFTYNKEFTSGLDTYNFMRGYQKSVAKGGVISKRAQRIAGGGAVTTEVLESRSKAAEAVNKIEQRLKNKLKQEGRDYTQEEFRKSDEFRDIFDSVVEPGGAINNYIKSLGMSPEKTKKVIQNVSDRLMNYNPQAKRKTGSKEAITIGEQIMSSTMFGKLDAAKELATKSKKEGKTVRIDAAKRTKEGDTTFDIEDTSTQNVFSETEDISLEAQAREKADKEAGKTRKTSKLRRKIGIETGGKIYNSVLDAARQALLKAYEAGTSVRNIQRKLRDQASGYLFKEIKNFLGTKTYVSNLRKFGEAIFDSLFTADLVQLEKNVPDDQRVFTEFEEKLTRKGDVEKAVNDGRLPPEAINTYDRDKSVNVYKKKKYNEEKWMAFFDIPTINPVTGARSGKRGTRKDTLSRLLSGSLAFDAIPQVAREPEVIKRRKEFAEIKGESDAINSLEQLAAEIHRQKDIDFSFSDLSQAQKNKTAFYFEDAANNLSGIGQQFATIISGLLNDGIDIQEAYLVAKENTGIDSDALDIIFKQGNFNKSHVENIKFGISKFGVAKVRKLGYDASIKYISRQLQGVRSLTKKIEIINDFLVNIGRSARTAAFIDKLTNITSNESLLFDFIDKLGDEQISKTYNLQSAPIKGKRIVYTDPSTNTVKPVPMYENIEKIKNNAYKSQAIRDNIKKEAKLARDYIVKIISDKTLSKAEKKAIIKLMGQDQRGALRKSFDLGMYIDRNKLDLNSEQTILEHELTISDTTKKINDVIDNNKSIDELRKILERSQVHILPKRLDNILTKEGLKYKGSFERYQNKKFKTELKKLIDNGSIKNVPVDILFKEKIDLNKKSKAVLQSRSANKETKGITILDFDDTLATTKSMIKFVRPDGTKGKLNAEQYASTYEDLLGKGYTFDFSEFNKVVDGKKAPLFNKALKLQNKFGPENMFVLTARPPESAKAIYNFLKSNGLNIPLKNITGLANSTAEAKALWVADKASEGYNDFYFADDALQNVQAVKNMLDQFDVKSKVQQAKVQFSNSMDKRFNDILEDITGIESKKRFDTVKARKRGEKKGRFRYFVPPSHEDFIGLLYNFLGKGKKGDANRSFFEETLIRPLNRAFREIDMVRQSVANDFKSLNKKLFPDVKKMLNKATPDGDFIYEDAIRIYIWSKHGYEIPGLSAIDQERLIDLVYDNDALYNYAETLDAISKQEAYVQPQDGWEGGNIRTDLDEATGRIGRKKHLTEFLENTSIIFSKENLNKIEAGFGKEMRDSIEDMLYRIETGINRPKGSNGTVNKFMNFLNGSVGSVMFFNMRSALLQQMSIVNYINFADNNIFAAAKAFANQKQFWKDFDFIFNSDMLKQRRGGLRTDINASELTETLGKSRYPIRVVINKLLQLGFKPTQIGDSIAISIGGASYYRNRINTYLKQGLTLEEAETKAFTDLQDTTQSTQQSSRPDMVSKQQASWIGKVILNFQNVTSQYNRIVKKAASDIYNGRITKPNSTLLQSNISNAARITYYFGIQNLIFYTLQNALFAMLFDDETEEENELFLKKKDRVINGTIDSVLRGSGITGAILSTLKNTYIAYQRQRDVNYNPDESAVLMEALNFSPVVGIKARKVTNAEKTLNYNKKVMEEMETFDIDNPMYSAYTNYIEAFTNLPLNRLYNKTQNLRQAFNNEHETWQRMMMFFGWSQYNLNIQNEKVENIKEEIKTKKKIKKTRNRKLTPSELYELQRR